MLKWAAVERGIFTRYYEVHQRDVNKNGCPRSTIICRLSGMATPEAKAIANLIAAAPDMRAALREVIGMLPALREVESVKTVLGVLE